jgi:prepilin-type N-terminal cleavage/methylation domain-containing protein
MNTNEKGFSLVELLVVVIIIAIVAAIAIPNLLASRRAANEASAISSLRTIHSAQVTYFATTGANSNYGTLAQLGTADLIDSALAAAGTKSGYTFALTLPGAAPFSVYCATAAPQTAGSTGDRYFGVGAEGVIYQSLTGAIGCSAGVLDTATNSPTPIQ